MSIADEIRKLNSANENVSSSGGIAMTNQLSYLKLYPFKRQAFYILRDKLKSEDRYFCLAGPRRCGKTVVLQQLAESSENVRYFNFKGAAAGKSEEVFDAIVTDVNTSTSRIYLLDELTYIDGYDSFIARLDFELRNVKVVFAGSQSREIERACSLAYCNVSTVRMGFYTFQEYLLKSEKIKALGGPMNEVYTKVTEDDYKAYLIETYNFYGIVKDNESYLKGCLDETLISNAKAYFVSESITEQFDVMEAINVLYAVLVSLHNKVSYNGLIQMNGLTAADTKNIRVKEVKDFLNEKNLHVSNMTTEKFRAILKFLIACDFVVLTVFSDRDKITLIDYLYNGKEMRPVEVLNKYCINIKYPLFYINLIRDLGKVCKLNIQDSQLTSGSILGSILECDVKGSISTIRHTNILEEYKVITSDNEDAAEVDYIDSNVAIEITVSNKKMSRVYLKEEALKDKQKFLLTKDKLQQLDDIYCVPYYVFLACITDIDFE